VTGELVVRTGEQDGRTVISAAGVMDYWNVDPLRKVLESAVSVRLAQVVLDLHEVTFVDSTGLALLVAADQSVRQQGGSLRLACPQEQLQRLLEITNLDRRLGLYDSVADAVADPGSVA
jgi:anti-anti-sigma factor